MVCFVLDNVQHLLGWSVHLHMIDVGAIANVFLVVTCLREVR